MSRWRKKFKGKIVLYDTTLREGDQCEYINFSIEDKLRILSRLDEFHMDYIEGGWPGANPRDEVFFKKAASVSLRHSRLVAFGMTRRAKVPADKDRNIRSLIASGATAATVVGKTWDLHVKEALGISFEENLEIIFDSISCLKKHLQEVFFDAEHFFDGYISNPGYALRCLDAARDAGADYVVLCDTNGGMLPSQVKDIVARVHAHRRIPLGIHCHNDSDTAVANTLAAVEESVTMVQGSINGYGERCGNANLCSIIPNLKFKMGLDCIDDESLRRLRACSRFVAELANQAPARQQPYVGDSAFAHKGGIHVSAVAKNPRTYEHVDPEAVGNRRRILVSDVSGKATIEEKAKEYDIDLTGKDAVTKEILKKLKDLEKEGYRFEAAEGSFELLMRRSLGERRTYFQLMGFRVLDEKRKDGEPPYSEATIMISVDGRTEHTAAEGFGPVNALDNALRKALEKFYPQLKDVRLYDYKVRVLPAGDGTASRVRVLVESGDGKRKWNTVGVSYNIIEASWQALVDSIVYKLQTDERERDDDRPDTYVP